MIRRKVTQRLANAVSTIEPLETRRLLSTINWSNKGSGPGDDTDSFNATYGANATVARNIVQRAIDDWERVIVDFNYAGGGNTFNVTISAGAISGRGVTNTIVADAQGKITSANIVIDDNAGGGWYFDPVIGSATTPDDGEFTNLLSPFAASFTGVGGANDDDDMYRTAAHELGHAMGIFVNNGGIVSGVPAILGFLTDTGIDDPLDGDTATLQNFNVGGVAVEATLTENGGGHFYEGTPQGGGTVSHQFDLLNPGRTVAAPPTTRQLISDLCATVLRDAYGYTIALPSTINTFYTNLNTTTNVVTVSGDINPNGSNNDVIDLEVSGTNMVFEVNGSSETIAGAQFTTIDVNPGLSNDDVDVDALLSGKTVTLNMSSGNDRVDVSAEAQDVDTSVDSNFTVNAGAGTDTITFHDGLDGSGGDTWTITSSTVNKGGRVVTYDAVELLDVNGSAQPTAYNIDGTAAGTLLDVLGGVGSDTFSVGNGDFDTNLGDQVSINGGGGSDPLTIDDTADGASGDVYDFDTGIFSKPGQILAYSNLESLAVLGSDQVSTYRINSTAIPLTITAGDEIDTVRVGDAVGSVVAGQEDINALISVNGGAGNDNFFVGNGDLDEISAPLIINGGGALGGNGNTLAVDDSEDVGVDQYDLDNGLLTKTAGGGLFVSLNYSFINQTQIDLNASPNVFNFTNGFGFPVIQGNGGADEFNIISSAPLSQTPTIRGGAGLDVVNVNEDEVGTATAIFDQDEDLADLNMYEGSTVNVAANGDNGIVTESFGFARGALNLNDNFLIVQNPSVSFLVDKLTRGYNGGGWNGVPAGGSSGVIRSSTAANSGSINDGVGYASVGAGNGLLNIATYRGAAVFAGDMIISYTLNGDNDLNRTVNISDFALLAANFNVAGTNWVRGNYDYNNTTNISDFAQLASNFNVSVAADLPRSLAHSPFGRSLIDGNIEGLTGSTDRIITGLAAIGESIDVDVLPELV